jgi:hypothetical protein
MNKGKEIKKAETGKKDAYLSKLSFYLALGFWIPFLNIGLVAISLWLAIVSVKRCLKHPDSFGGMGYAIASIIIGVTTIAMTIIGLIIYMNSDRICLSSICSAALAAQ